MTPERWQEVERLYQAVIGLDGSDRSRFLDNACIGDEDLLNEVTSLLARASRADSFLERPTPLRCGERFGAYEIEALIGAGGMGEVYRARDTKLGREVAIKVLPEIFTRDPERRARFDREAHVLATLNHPRIGAIYGVEDVGLRRGLILELVHGPRLADRLHRGPIPIDETLKLASQIADALAAAHEHGIIHRDLKPANIKLTPEGKVKVLDFGLAKLANHDVSAVNLSYSPTIAADHTRDGILLGTAAYMSPEQARGQAVDKRTDIWAFGCVLYEMLTGRSAFAGATVSDIIAAVIEREPNLDLLPTTTPADVRKLLNRCLQKDPERRLRDAADASLEIEDILRGPRVDISPPTIVSRTRPLLALSAIVVLSIAALAVLTWRLRASSSETHRPVVRITLALSADNSLVAGPIVAGSAEVGVGGIAISPDVQTLAFVARSADGSRLYLRHLDEWEPRAVPGGDGAQNPFFSPDGQWVAFSRLGQLEKSSVLGGAPRLICQLQAATGGSWGPDGFIVFGSWPKVGLWRVSADGGTPEVLIRPQEGSGIRYSWPERLPDSDAILFTVWGGGRTSVAAFTPGAREPRTIVESASHPHYLPTGHLVYLTDDHLVARPFNVKSLVAGDPSAVVAELNQNLLSPSYAVSREGTLAYFPSWSSLLALAWRDRQGVTAPLALKPRRYGIPGLSPDGQRLVVMVQTGAARNIWIGSVEREPLTRLTFGNDDYFGLWTRDGRRVVYTSFQNGHYDIFWTSSDGSGSAEPLRDSEGAKKGTSWSPNGDVLLLNEDSSTGMDVWQWFADRRDARPLLKTRFHEMEAVFSPDGRWVAYQSDESGQNEVYAQAYPGPGPKVQVSNDGGSGPLWNRNGRELFYQTPNAIMAVPVFDAEPLRFGTPVRLFTYSARGSLAGGRAYDVSPDGQRFLTIEPANAAHAPSQINLVQNWFEEVRRSAPPRE